MVHAFLRLDDDVEGSVLLWRVHSAVDNIGFLQVLLYRLCVCRSLSVVVDLLPSGEEVLYDDFSVSPSMPLLVELFHNRYYREVRNLSVVKPLQLLLRMGTLNQFEQVE